MRVLVTGTNRACHHRLRRHGHELVLFMPRGKARPEDLGGPYRHVVVLADDAELELWVDTARACHRAEPFDAVVAYNESTYRAAGAIATGLGIGCSIDVELFERVLNKARTRDILAEKGIPGCRYAYVQGRDAVGKAIEDIGTPCIVKPVDGEGSLGVAKITSPDGVEPALRWVGDRHVDRGLLVEEYLVGEELSVEAVSTRDRHHIVAVTKKYINDQTFVERGHLVPAPLSPAVRTQIEEYVTRVLDALGFHDCPSHTELMLTPHGPRLIETHNRIGGDRIMDLVQHSTGVGMYDLVARQSLGEDITPLLPDPVPHLCSAAVWYADPSACPEQKLVEVSNVDRVRALPYVKTLDLLKEPGSRHAAVRTSFDRSALVVVVADSPAEALRRARGAIGELAFSYVWAPEPEPEPEPGAAAAATATAAGSGPTPGSA